MKALFIIVPILLVGGAFGAAKMGVIQVPGISPKKVEAKKQGEPNAEQNQPVDAETMDQTDLTEPTDSAAQQPQIQPAIEQTETPTDPEAGAKALAKYWDAIPTNKLVPITDTYSEKDLALVLQFMQKPKVAEIMGAIEKLTAEFWPGIPVIPIMSTGATDSTYLRNAGIPAYGHSGLADDVDDFRAHGKDERVPVKSFFEGLEYLYRLVKTLSGAG